ncbi:hypothetical protein Tco_0839159 [Tanacetum coccineum]|uniref:CheW-like domain-containing protein n=1 Tax=Tanacetum coccineum TaxID=301880 RepID=A0ABQ5ASD6_9ASTR
MSSLKFKVFLVNEELEYGVLLPNDVNYSNLVRYVKKKFKVGDANQISLSYNIGSIFLNIIDDDDIKSFLCYMRSLIIIDIAHLKGTYLGMNLVAVGMDGNNQIIPIATGVSQASNQSLRKFMLVINEKIEEGEFLGKVNQLLVVPIKQVHEET